MDKAPLNFIHLGLIACLLPKVAIVHCVRDPLDTCLSCFFQHFTTGHLYSYELATLGGYYRQYRRLMDHWRSVLPVTILDVSYEALVADPEPVVRRILEHCGLSWDPHCLEPDKARTAVTSASTWQVRQPIYRSSVGRWRHYERFLAPLIEALGDEEDHTPDQTDQARV